MACMYSCLIAILFHACRYPYAQFPCESITGDLLFEPFWQAVYRLERLGLKVRDCTNGCFRQITKLTFRF